MTWFNFNESLLDIYYTNLATGGPEFSTAIPDTSSGLELARIGRYDFISRYSIDYSEMKNQRRKDLRSFHIMNWGQGYGFRFLAPDDDNDDAKGFCVDATFTLKATVASGTLTYYLIKKYSLLDKTYYKRIIKPGWSLASSVYTSAVTLKIGATTVTFDQITNAADGAPDYGRSSAGVFGGSTGITLYFREGRVVFTGGAATAANGQALSWVGTFHVPARFTTDWNQMRTDETTVSDWTGIGLRELLPIALGITI